MARRRSSSFSIQVKEERAARVRSPSMSSESEESAATCTASQVLVRTCTTCGAEDHKMGVGATGHTWGAWTEVSADTMSHSCTVCGFSATAPIVAGAPFIKSQPAGGSIFPGGFHTMTVEATASGLGTLTYQWMRCDSPGGKAEPAPGMAGDVAYEASEQGFYFVRITQTAGSASNILDSDLAYVHVHALGEWVVDEAAGTVTRECTDTNCGLTESYTIEQFRAAYPDEAKALGLSGFAAWYKANTVLFWCIVGGGVLLVVVIVLLAVLLSRNRKLKEMQAAKAPAHAPRHTK